MKKLIIIFIFLMTNTLAADIWQEMSVPYQYIGVTHFFKLNGNIIADDSYFRNNKWVTYKSGNWVAVEDEFISNIEYFHNIDQLGNKIIISIRDGIFSSNDSGNTWNELPIIKDNSQLLDIEITIDKEIFGLTAGFGRGLYNYSESNKQWQLIEDKKQDTTLPLYVQEIESNDDYIFGLQKKAEHPLRVGDTLEGGLYMSSNSGESWEKKLVDSAFYSIFVVKDTILLCTDNGYLIRSEDNGNSWSEKYIGTRLKYYLLDNDKIIAASNPKGIISSEDYGKTWEVEVDGLYADKILKTGNKYFFLDKVIYESDTNFTSVKKTNFTIDSTNIYRIRWHNDTLFATGTFKRGLQYSTDHGANWQTYSDFLDKNRISLTDVKFKDDSVLICPNSGLYTEAYYYSHDHGRSWQFFQPDYFSSNPYIRNIIILDNKILFSTGSGIKISNDNGKTQEAMDTSVIKNDYRVDHITKTQNGNLFAFTFRNGVFKSSDKANSWEKIIDSLPIDTNFTSIKDFYEFNENYYAINSTPLNILVSKDKGKSWKNMNIDFSEFGKYIELLMLNENSILLSTKDGIKISNDVGKSWETVSAGLDNNIESRYDILNIIGNYVFIDGGGKLYRTSLEKLGVITSVENESETKPYLYTEKPYPLPAGNSVTAEIYWGSNFNMEKADIGVYDLKGNRVESEENIEINTQSRWPGRLTWDCSQVSDGIYFIVIEYGQSSKSIPIIKNSSR